MGNEDRNDEGPGGSMLDTGYWMLGAGFGYGSLATGLRVLEM